MAMPVQPIGVSRSPTMRTARTAAMAGSDRVTVVAVLAGVRGIAFTEFSKEDVVRHPLVARIVEAYDLEAARVERAKAAARAQHQHEKDTKDKDAQDAEDGE